ncbi:MAG: hypothetical protein GY737_16670 [Desulfobacteraceae bacterium]|nr:hypothetical protein [Desulfobacteraceae bacterium]
MTEQLTAMLRYEEYKDSGVEWLGKIPAQWEVKRLKFVTSIFRGKFTHRPRNDDRLYGGEYPFFQTGDVAKAGKYLSKYKQTLNDKGLRVSTLIPKGTVVITIAANIGDVSILETNACFPDSVVGFKPKDNIYRDYLFYGLGSMKEQFVGSTIKNTQMNLNVDRIGSNFITCPSIKKQTAIAAFLDHKTAQIDQAVEIKKQKVAQLKEHKQILIQNAVTRGLNPDAPMRDSGVDWIGEIPTHWHIVANRTLFKERVEPGQDELPLLSVSIHSGVSTGELHEDENIRGRVKIEDKTKYNLVKPDDIVFNMMRAWQGAIGAVKVKGMVSPAYIIAIPKGSIKSKYFEYQYRCPIFIQQMDRFSKGITDFRKRLYWHEFKQLVTLLPPTEEQTAIVTHIETESAKIDKAIDLQEQQIDKLEEYKTTLINSAVTGKIKVPMPGKTAKE